VKDSANLATLYAARATYSLSKRTAAYVTAGRINNKGSLAISVSAGAPGSNPAPGNGQNGLMVGLRHAF
jgi:predicted porin